MPKKKKVDAVETSKNTTKFNYGVVSYRMTYIWSDKNTRSQVLKIVTQGMIVEIISEEENDWTKVKTLDKNPVLGYMRSVFVRKSEG
jgi:hypothetical protein